LVGVEAGVWLGCEIRLKLEKPWWLSVFNKIKKVFEGELGQYSAV